MRFLFVLFFLATFCLVGEEPPKTVLMAILARNKAHLLPYYLKCIEDLDYDKKAISLYIHTNNNEDQTAVILKEWIKKIEGQYSKIFFETKKFPSLLPTKPHVWNPSRFKALGSIRNRSLQLAKQLNCDFYFVADCDNFIAPVTLKELVNKDKPIIAPLLLAIPVPGDIYSNFLCTAHLNSYAKHPDYLKILHREMVGTFEVPIVHCTYLVKSEFLDLLGYQDTTSQHEFVIFSRMARNHGVAQYICNEKEFGVLLHHPEKLTLEEEALEFQRWVESPLY